MAKKMLITGASSGIGKSFVDHYKDKYDLITTARTEKDWITDPGDITDKDFRNDLIAKHQPNVVINNAGGFRDNFEDTYQLNTIAAGHIFEGFYDKMMPYTHIFNVVSYGIRMYGWQDMSRERSYYYSSKKAFYEFANNVNMSKNRPVHVVNLVPGIVKTEMVDADLARRIKINQGHVEEADLDYYLKENYHRGKIPFHSFFPIGREDLPIIAQFIMTLPDYINIDEIVVGMFNKQQLPGRPTTQ